MIEKKDRSGFDRKKEVKYKMWTTALHDTDKTGHTLLKKLKTNELTRNIYRHRKRVTITALEPNKKTARTEYFEYR